MTQRIGVIWAEARGGVIGVGGGMPWSLPEDMARFKAITMGSAVVMGRRTWESFGTPPRPLSGRDNIVVTRDAAYRADGASLAGGLGEALALAATRVPDAETIWVIGGGQLYRDALPLADVAEITEIDADIDGDTTAPALGEGWATTLLEPADGWLTSRKGLRYRYRTLQRATPAPLFTAV